MKNESMRGAIKGIRRLVESRQAVELSDRELLERFVARKDEAAFAQLVRRHGPIVLGICRRVLRNQHDAEDAFQAAFLVLARKASSLRDRGSAGGWLFRVTYHLALKMKAHADRKRTCVLLDIAQPDPEDGRPYRELLSILDEELARLPEKYRVVLLMCHCEGATRAEAARKLGWKEGKVKICLERGRALLKARLARRGMALSGLFVGSLLAQNAAAVPSCLLRDTVAFAARFALGNLPASAIPNSAAVLAQRVLKAMLINRIKLAVLLVLSAGIAFFGAGLGAYQALAKTLRVDGLMQSEFEREPQPGPHPKAPAEVPKKPLRALLFADGPTREYQCLRSFFVKQVDQKRMELSIHLQSGGRDVVQDVPPDRLLQRFPTRLDLREGKDAEDKPGNLAAYDVIIAFDPDWTKLTKEQVLLLDRWVRKEGGALIHVAGPVHTFELGPPALTPERLRPILDLLPVLLADSRVEEERETNTPWPLRFPGAEKFLKLDEEGNDPLAGWSEFFFDKQRDDWQRTEDQPTRGFYTAYPVKSVKRTAKVIATFRHPKARIAADEVMPQELPYLVAMQQGKGKTLYLGSGELWRLRQFNKAFYERLWSALAQYAAAPDPVESRRPDTGGSKITPEQRNAIDKGLKWLVRQQHRDGHWEGNRGRGSVMMTSLAGMALLMQGSTIREGEYAQNIRKAVDWLMVRSQADGRIGNPDGSGEAEKYMNDHGRAVRFLASVFGDEEDSDRRLKLQRILTRAIEFTAKSQTSGGGWSHVYRGLVKEDDDPAEVGATVIQIQALRAARSAGIVVPKKCIDAARNYLKQKVDPSTPAAIVSLAGVFGPDDYSSPVAKQWLQAIRVSAPALDAKQKRQAGDELYLYSFAFVAYSLGEDGQARMFPATRSEERITWSGQRTKLFSYLLQIQDSDGAWDGELGKVYASAMYLAVLQLDYGLVPVYQR